MKKGETVQSIQAAPVQLFSNYFSDADVFGADWGDFNRR
jgi:hypothetical protein